MLCVVSGSFRASPGEEVLDLVGSTSYDLDSLRRQEQTLASPDGKESTCLVQRILRDADGEICPRDGNNDLDLDSIAVEMFFVHLPSF